MPHYKKKKTSGKHSNKNRSPSSSTTTSDTLSISEEEICTKLEQQLNVENQPYKIEHSDVYGRYLVSTRSLNAGEVVIKELPLVIGPCGEQVCLGCYNQLPIRPYKCHGCGWPLCGVKCQGLKMENGHSSWECSTLREHRVADHLERANTEWDLISMYEAITPLRCLLLKRYDTNAWECISTMESHNELRRKVETLWERNQKLVVNQLRNVWGLEEFSEDDIHTVCGILEVNCFEIGQNGARARALYDKAFLLAHNCCANTSHSDDPKTFEMTIRILQDLPPNEAITLSYAYTLQGTLKRRDHLQEGKFFWCTCKRCTDPTELGTYASAIKCPKCNDGGTSDSGDGLILSTNPLDQSAAWKCDKCNYIVGGETMTKLVETVSKELDTIDSNDIVAYEKFLDKYRNVFHKFHYLCMCAKHSLFQLYGRSENFLIHQLTPEQLKVKEQYCRDMLAVAVKIEPGLSKLQGIIMYELHAAVMIQATRSYETNEIDNAALKIKLREVVKLLKDSERILSMEPIGSSEHTMAIAARDALQRIGKI